MTRADAEWNDFLRLARAGIPLDRSPELMALAKEVADRHQREPPAFDDEWVERLAADLAKFQD